MKKDDVAVLAAPRRAGPEPSSVRIGIFGHVGNENLGDESIIAAVIQNVRHRWPDAAISGFTLNPDDTKARHGIRSFAIRRGAQNRGAEAPAVGPADPGQLASPSFADRTKELVKRVPTLSSFARGVLSVLEAVSEIVREIPFLLESRQSARGLDLLIIAGSHQLNDFVNGPWNFPFTVLKWTLIARSVGAKVVFLSLGAGPIDTWLGRQFIRHALKVASYRSYRDETAKRTVDTLKGFEADKIVPDLAFSLDWQASPKTAHRGGPPAVGINPLPLFADYWFTTDGRRYETYVGKLAKFADWLVERGYEVRFIPTQLKVDPTVIEDVIERMTTREMPEHDSQIVVPTVLCLDDLLSALADLDIMVATRYHGIVLSLAQHKPVLAIAYHSKSQDMMNWLGQGDYVVDGNAFSVEMLTERLSSLEKARESTIDSLRQQTPEFQSSLRSQYDEVFNLTER